MELLVNVTHRLLRQRLGEDQLEVPLLVASVGSDPSLPAHPLGHPLPALEPQRSVPCHLEPGLQTGFCEATGGGGRSNSPRLRTLRVPCGASRGQGW